MKEITVIIPNYNGIQYIKECLNSLYQQEPNTPDFSVLVVDNGSTDGSLEECQKAFPQTQFIALSENTGFCHAVNIGIKNTDSPYIILLNNDTKVKPEFVKSLYRAIRKNKKIFSVSAKMLMWDKPELLDDAGDYYCVFGWSYASGKGKPAVQYQKPAEVFSACAGAAIYRRKVFNEIGLFDEAHFAYLEDLDIGYRAKIHGYYNYYEPKAEVLHYGSASTGSRYNKKKTLLAASNNVYVIWKNMPVLQLLWNLPFLLTGFLVKFLFFCRKKMGILYLKGIILGLKKCMSAEGKKAKVAFQPKYLKHYLAIQFELYLNVLKIIQSY